MELQVLQPPVVRQLRAAAAHAVAAQNAPAKTARSELYRYAYRPVRRSSPLFDIQQLELAPEGWRLCVEKMAEGFAEIIGEHAYCLNCAGVLEGAQGHDITCPTMLARRILANEPLLHIKHGATSFPGVDIDAVHARAGAAPADGKRPKGVKS